MLGRLIKYEFKATQRVFLPLYGLIIACAALIRVFMLFNLQKANNMAVVPFVISIIVYAVLIAAVFVMTLVVTIQRFQKNLLGDEGYLSFTLPVKTHSQIDSKMIVSLVWTVLSLAVAALSVFILVYDVNFPAQWAEFWRSVRSWFRSCGAVSHVLVWECVVLAVASVLAGILQLYASVVVGNFSGKHKLLAGFGTFIGFSVVEQVAASMIVNWVSSALALDGLRQSVSEIEAEWAIVGVLGVVILFVLIFGLAFYFLTNWLLSRKLNLE